MGPSEGSCVLATGRGQVALSSQCPLVTSDLWAPGVADSPHWASGGEGGPKVAVSPPCLSPPGPLSSLTGNGECGEQPH